MLPRPDHVVVVVEEDHSYQEVLGPAIHLAGGRPSDIFDVATQDPYLRQLASLGASMTNMVSVGHHNAQTYQALFSGLNPSASDRPWLQPYTAPNIASGLIAAGLSFAGYNESLPSAGYMGPSVGDYQREHNSWVDFSNVPASSKLPFSAFPTDFNRLPTVSYVVPNLKNDMHSGWVSTADEWLQSNIKAYANWAIRHNSLLIVTWDESHASDDNIPTLFFGPMVEPGQYDVHTTQPDLLRTIENMYGLPATGQSADATPITDVFNKSGLSKATVDAALKHRPAASGSASIAGRVTLPGPTRSITSDGDDPQARWWIYLDSNNDGIFEPGEPLAYTDRHGRFAFSHLAPGTYTARVVRQPGFSLASGDAGITITLLRTAHVKYLRFSEQRIAL